jgi:dTDP-4-dehydrorhamnose 3,5-epimerase-like enzyme
MRPKTDYERERDGELSVKKILDEKKCGFRPKGKVHLDDEKKAWDKMLKAEPRKFIEGSIDGLLKIPLKWHVDDRGMLMEILRANDEHYINATDAANPHEGNFGQTYVVIDPMPYTTRAFHKHGLLWDFFTIIHGSAKFIFFDDRDGKNDTPLSDTYEYLEIVVTGKTNPMCIVVPPGVYHGWMSLEPNTILLSTGTHVYSEVVAMHGKPDECRISPYTFGDLWKIEAK